ncbi:UNVERIFIED_CONTAM: ABC transporter A family member 7 [Sesamum radiatum]|uniref:ABC transporter A family member 7 n=1 Tax=Sesamum radiatum TaxID=300843 RepID=A0AAW2PHJ3_SESRA
MQKRAIKTNIQLVAFPFFLCLLLLLIQTLVNNELDKPSNRCGCTCVDTGKNGQCERRCGIEYSTPGQVLTCSIPHPPPLPPLLQIPSQQYRAVRTDFMSYRDLPDDSCKRTGSCPVTMLITGDNQTFGQSVAGYMFARPLNMDLSDILNSLSEFALMIGLTKPSAGTAYVQGLDIRTDMDRIYTRMGVCPQHENLSCKIFAAYCGKNFNSISKSPGILTAELIDLIPIVRNCKELKAVEESLKSVNLFHGGVADKQAGKYSGGMKRRLSVAISLIGDPKVVYMDEPSTGLDPASRNMLRSVVKRAKENRAIILTTHSMEEAEHLCDRLGIFVDGSLQCVGNPKELKARYRGSYVFTVTTSPNHEEEVENLVRHLTPNATRIYHIPGTQKFELPKHEIRIADVFEAIENAKSRFTIQAWGVADTTLEDVFIKVARGA